MTSACRRSAFFLLLIVLLLSGTLLAQAAENQSAAAPKPVAHFTSRAQLVLVPVVVTDGEGHHVSGLKREDFRIEERGKPRTPSIFEEVNSVTPDVQARAAMPATGHSNFTFGNTDAWRVTIVVLDAVNTPALAQVNARRQLIQYLEKGLKREEPTALYGLTRRGLKLLHPLTRDTAALTSALRKVRTEFSNEELDAGTSVVDPATDSLSNSANESASEISQFMRDCDTTASAFQQRGSIHTTLAALRQIAEAFAAVPGRKTLIWATGGIPFTLDDPQAFAHMGTDMQGEYQEVWRTLSAAGMAVYTVDVRGLLVATGALSKLDASSRAPSIPYRMSRTTASRPSRISSDPDLEKQTALRAFAENLGGTACISSNDLERCFERAVEDSRAYYMIGYYLPADDLQPGWRKLKVKVNVEGAKTRTIAGFFANAPAEESPQARQAQMMAALRSPVEFTGVRMNVREAPAPADMPPAAGKSRHEFLVGMPARSVTVDNSDNNLVDVSVIVVAVDEEGRNRGQGDNQVTGHLKQETADKIRKAGMNVQVGVDLAPGKYELRFAVRDNLNGEVGSVVFPLEVK